jgi:ribosomal protein RSM22 (predicted rRNA methylase)
MLSRSIRPRLCQSCRNSLLSLFENGFGSLRVTPSPRRRIHWTPSRRSLGKHIAVRTFSSKNRLYNTGEGSKTPSAAPADVDVVNQEYRGQIESTDGQTSVREAGDGNGPGIAETEDYKSNILYGPHDTLKSMIQTGEKDLEGEGLLSDAEVSEQNIVQQETELPNLVEAMRDADGSVEEVVREARQLHGEYLPEGVLSEDEMKTYRRLYGDPAEEVEAEEITAEVEESRDPHELLDQDGEAIAYYKIGDGNVHGHEVTPPISAEVEANNTKSIEQRTMEVAKLIGGEVRPYEVNRADEETAIERGHPLTVAGRFQTSPRTIFLPQETFVQPVQKILSEHSNKQVKEMSERLFGGPGLPDSPLTPRIGRILPQKAIPIDASQHAMGTMEANAYISTVWPSTYAAVSCVLVETRKRLGSSWLRDLITKEGGPSVLDAGAAGVGVLAWRDIVTAEWEALHSSDASPPPPPLGKSTVLTGADNLRHRAAALLDNTTFLPRLPDYVHVRDSATLSDDRPATQRKQFDVVIAPHTLWALGEDWQRKQQVQNLWSMLNPEGGVLILIEKGVPRGFEVIAGAREFLLSRYIATADSPTYESRLESSNEVGTVKKGKGLILAPCTNHAPCPMLPVPGISRGRKDYCSFQQRYIRPPFLQRVLGAKDRNHDDVDFSYVAVQKGRDLQDTSTTAEPVFQGKLATDSAFEGYEDATEPEEAAKVSHLTLPRLVFPPLKRPGHVTIDLCTPAGKIDRWTVSKSFSKTAYRDARKANWGDLWALGAKTRVPRNLQLGGEKSKRGKNQNERMMGKARDIYDRMQEDKMADREMEEEMEMAQNEELDAILQDEHDDADAAEVLREIEMEKQQKMTEASKERTRIRSMKAPRGGRSISDIDKPTSPSELPGGLSKEDVGPFQEALARVMGAEPKHAAAPSSSHASTLSTHEGEQLSPEELATLSDFAAESRTDQLESVSANRLSGMSANLRMKWGGNKFTEPGKERWRAKMEKRKAVKRERGKMLLPGGVK